MRVALGKRFTRGKPQYTDIEKASDRYPEQEYHDVYDNFKSGYTHIAKTPFNIDNNYILTYI